MSKAKSQSIDNRLLGVPEVSERIDQVRMRFDYDDEGTDEFLRYVPFIQYGIPFGELQTLISSELIPRTYGEYDILTGNLGEATDDMTLFWRYVREPVARDKGYSFVFFGPNGSGKTMLALKILCGFIERGCRGYYLMFKDYMRIFNDAAYSKDYGANLLHKHLLTCDLLVLDEVGKESKASDNVTGEFERLLKERSSQNLSTIMVTNLRFSGANSNWRKLPKEEKVKLFRMRYGASAYDVLLQKYRFIQFSKTGNFRVKTREQWQI